MPEPMTALQIFLAMRKNNPSALKAAIRNKKYWHARIDGELQSIYEEISRRNEKLYQTYQRAYENMNNEMAAFIRKHGEDGMISRSEYYAYSRNLDLIENMRKELEKVGYAEVDFMEDSLTRAYKESYKAIGKDLNIILDQARKFNSVPVANLERALRLNIQNKHFSDRIWANKGKALSRIQETLEDAIAQNMSYDQASRLLAERMNVSYSDAERLVSTEMNHIITQAEADSFEEYGLKRYEIIAVMDSRTTEICRTFDGKEFNLSDRSPGINAPPFHVRCRTTIAPAIDWGSADIPEE